MVHADRVERANHTTNRDIADSSASGGRTDSPVSMNPLYCQSTVAEPLERTPLPMTDQPEIRADLIVHARWIIPVEPEGRIHDHHALVVRDGRIAALLPDSEARRLPCTERLELPEHVVLPGLVNAHGHAAMSLLRGYADDQPLAAWLNDHIWPAEGRWISADFVRDGTRLALVEMLRAGTTCFSDMYFFPGATARAAADAGVRAQVAFPVFEFPSAWGQNADDYIAKGLQLLDDYKYSDLIQVVFGPHAPYTVDDPALSRIAVLAAELDSPIQIHIHETQAEVDEALARTGERPLARLARLGLLGPRTQCVHAVALDEADIALLAETGAQVVHCPKSNLKLASGFAPVARLLQAGVNVALGTDGAASSNDLDLFGELRLAAMLAKAVTGDASAVPARQALAMATLGGARALGLDEQIGSLTPGKAADFIAVDLSAPEHQPLHDPLSQLVYTQVSGSVTHAWVAGRCLLRERRLTTLDQAAILANARGWQALMRTDPETQQPPIPSASGGQ